MGVPGGHDQLIESSIVLRRLKDVKAAQSHEKGQHSGASGLGIQVVSIAVDTTMKPRDCGAWSHFPCRVLVVIALDQCLVH
jgi:hypothetical protein